MRMPASLLCSFAMVMALATASLSAPVGAAFDYQGRLLNAGTPAEGFFDFEFRLYDSESGGIQVGATDCEGQVPVAAGIFTVSIDFGTAAFDGASRWLELRVRPFGGPGSRCNLGGGYTPLVPRQLVGAAPHALRASSAPTGHALDAADGSPVNALTVDNDGRVGVGSSSPATTLHVTTNGTLVPLTLQRSGTGGTALRMRNAAASGDWSVAAGSNDAFGIFESGDAFGSKLSITPDGNVGIGTSNPEHQLHLSRDGSGPDGMKIENLSAADVEAPAEIVFRRTNISVTQWAAVGMDHTARDFFIWVNGDDRLIITDLGRVGIGTHDPGSHRLAITGQAAKPGGGSWSVYSDSRIKRDITPMSGTLDKLLRLHGYEFEYRPEAIASHACLPGRQIGLLAEEVEEVFPDWVERDGAGLRSVTERGTTALTVEAFRDLRSEKDAKLERLREEKNGRIAALESRIQALEAMVDALEAEPAEDVR